MKITNKQISKTFKLAKSLLCDGSCSFAESSNSPFICNAIDAVSYMYEPSNPQYLDICKSIIMSRFPDRPTEFFQHSVETYLYEVVKVPHSKLTYINVQKFRHRWLDSLIKEFDIPGNYKG